MKSYTDANLPKVEDLFQQWDETDNDRFRTHPDLVADFDFNPENFKLPNGNYHWSLFLGRSTAYSTFEKNHNSRSLAYYNCSDATLVQKESINAHNAGVYKMHCYMTDVMDHYVACLKGDQRRNKHSYRYPHRLVETLFFLSLTHSFIETGDQKNGQLQSSRSFYWSNASAKNKSEWSVFSSN